jgi:hypothetical protein
MPTASVFVAGHHCCRDGSAACYRRAARCASPHAKRNAVAALLNPCAHRNGVEVPAQLVWSKWQPGGEYVKTITVKNVSKRVRGLACSAVDAAACG